MSDSGKLSCRPAAGEAGAAPRISILRPLLFLLVLAGAVAAVRLLNLQEYLEEERLRLFLKGYGVWGPVVYLLLWTIVPSLFIPSLPLTLAGGILFGPLWGLVYTVGGATVGAAIAFLVARHLARDWVAHKISGTRLCHLDAKVAEHGWKVVVLMRLIPVFPFFMQNYALGLTRIALLPYTLATFFAILPWTFAYIYFASNLLVLFQGQLSRGFLIGAALVTGVALLSRVLKKRLGQKDLG